MAVIWNQNSCSPLNSEGYSDQLTLADLLTLAHKQKKVMMALKNVLLVGFSLLRDARRVDCRWYPTLHFSTFLRIILISTISALE